MSTAKKSEKSSMITKELVVVNKLGIHARPAAMFVRTANKFESKVFVEKDGETVNGKSIMGLMMLAAGPWKQNHNQSLWQRCRRCHPGSGNAPSQ